MKIICMVMLGILMGTTGCTKHQVGTETVLHDITDLGGKVEAKLPDFISHEGAANAFDNSLNSKFLSEQPSTWLSFSANQPEQLKRYSIRSAGDAPMRDPHHWQLKGSNDKVHWQLLDKVEGWVFDKRNHTDFFEISNSQAFLHYRLELTSRGTSQFGDNYLQLSDIGLYATTPLPLADFKISETVVSPGQQLTITSQSVNQPEQFSWQIPGADLKGHGEQISLSFSKPGTYSVTLNTKNQHGKHQKHMEAAIKVLDPKQPWLGFKPAKVAIEFEDTQSDGYQRLTRIFPNLEQTINEVTYKLVPMLYQNFAQVPYFAKVTFQLKWMDTIAYRAGDENNMIIAFSSKYIAEKLAQQPDSQVEYELLGVLWHELTHGYQLSPIERTYGEPEVHAFIEGMADLVRIDAGFHKTRTPKPSDNWLGGYTNTGFFLHWLKQQYGNDFTYQFNQTARTVSPWSFAGAIEQVTGEKLQPLWQAYQDSLTIAALAGEEKL